MKGFFLSFHHKGVFFVAKRFLLKTESNDVHVHDLVFSHAFKTPLYITTMINVYTDKR